MYRFSDLNFPKILEGISEGHFILIACTSFDRGGGGGIVLWNY